MVSLHKAYLEDLQISCIREMTELIVHSCTRELHNDIRYQRERNKVAESGHAVGVYYYTSHLLLSCNSFAGREEREEERIRFR